jgi:hypothetical protein
MTEPKTYWQSFPNYAKDWDKIITGKHSPRSNLFHPDLLALEDCPVQESHWLTADRFQTKAKGLLNECLNEIITRTPRLSNEKYNPKRPKPKTLYPQKGVYPANLPTPPGGFYSLDEKLKTIYQRSADGYYQLEVDPKTIDRARALLKLGVLRKALLTMQQSTANETDMSDQLKKGKRIYEGIVKEFGKVKNWTMCRSDPRYYGIQSAFEDDKGRPTEFLVKRVRWRSKVPDFKSIVHAAQVSIGHCLQVDVDWIVSNSSWEKDKVESTLLQEGYLYPHWDGEKWTLVDMDDYIQIYTNIREHDRLLDEMRDRFVDSYGEEQFLRNKKVIQEAFPMPSSPPTSDVRIKRQAAIDAGFNFDEFDNQQKTECLSSGREIKLEISHWLISTEYYELYYLERFGAIAEVKRDTVFGLSKITATFGAVPNHSPNGLPSTKKHTGIEVFTRLLKGQSAQYKEEGTDADGKKKVFVNEEESAALAEAYKAWRKDFFDWLWSGEERALAIAKRFNLEVNTTATIKARGEFMVDEHGGFPEITMPPGFNFHPYQLDGIYQLLRYGRLLVPLGCGAGKTLIALIACLIAKARGLASKPGFCVLKATKHAMVQEAKRIAPWARIFYLSETDRGTKRHEKLMALMHGEFDLAILTHDDMELIPMGSEGVQLAYSAQIEALEEELSQAQNDRAKFKAIGAQIQALQTKMQKTLDRNSKIHYCFEDFGFDLLIYDEFHLWGRRPGVRTSYGGVKGIATEASARAITTMLRFHYMMGKGYRIGAMTATPIVASLVEMYSLMRYFLPDILDDKGMAHADDWIETFCSITAENSFGSGGRMRVVEEVRDFNNIDLMLSLMRRFMLLVPISEQKRILKDRPQSIDITIACPPTVGQCQFYEEIVRRVDAIMAQKPKSIPTQKVVTNEEGEESIETVIVEDNHLVVYNHMRNAGLMAQVAYGSMGIDEPFSVNNKVFRCAQNVYKVKQFLNKYGVSGHQLIFLDLSTKKKGMFSVYGVLERVFEAMGLRVAIVHDLKDPQVELTRIALDQEADVILVSTRKGATGVDHLQDHCIAMHHLDVPTMPAALTQREGRGVRIGNKFPKILQFFYVTQGANGNAGVDTLSLQACQTRMVPYLNLMGGINPGDSISDIGGEVMLLLEELKGIATGDSTYAELSALKNQIVLLEAAYKSEQLAIAKDISDRTLASTKIEANISYLESVKPFEKKIDGLKAIVFHLHGFDLRVEKTGKDSYLNTIKAPGDKEEQTVQKSTSFLMEQLDKKVSKTKGGDVFICKVMDFELYAITIVPEGKLITEIIGYYLSYPETGFRASVKLQVSDIFRTIAEHITQAIAKAKNELSFYTKLQDSEPLVPTFDMEELQSKKERAKELTAEIKSLDNLKQKRVLNVGKAYDLGFSEQQVGQIEEALELSQNGQLRKAKQILDSALTIYGYDEDQQELIEELNAMINREATSEAIANEQAVARAKLEKLLTKKKRVRIEEITELVKDNEGEGEKLKLVPIATISCDPPIELVQTLMEEPPVFGEDGHNWLSDLDEVLTDFTRKPLLLEESEDED